MPCYDPEPLKGVVASIKAAARPLALEFLKRPEPELVVKPSAGAEAAEAQPSDEDMYSPSGGTRGGGTKVLAKAVRPRLTLALLTPTTACRDRFAGPAHTDRAALCRFDGDGSAAVAGRQGATARRVQAAGQLPVLRREGAGRREDFQARRRRDLPGAEQPMASRSACSPFGSSSYRSKT